MSDRVIGGYALRRVLGRGGMGEVHLAATPPPAGWPPSRSSTLGWPATPPSAAGSSARWRPRAGSPGSAPRPSWTPASTATSPTSSPSTSKAPTWRGPCATRGRCPGGNLEALAVGIATALSAIHGAGVIHRDLKPSNVLLSPLGPRVIDFGIAQLVGSDTSQAILGTPAFMAPEQARGETVGPFTDVFAWGGVIAFARHRPLPVRRRLPWRGAQPRRQREAPPGRAGRRRPRAGGAGPRQGPPGPPAGVPPPRRPPRRPPDQPRLGHRSRRAHLDHPLTRPPSPPHLPPAPPRPPDPPPTSPQPAPPPPGVRFRTVRRRPPHLPGRGSIRESL
ncbi:protein kinase [Nonomuraea ferruginea]